MALLLDETPFTRAVAALLTGLAWVLMVRPQSDPDFWWHLEVAEYIGARGDVPRSDFISWQAFGEPWIAHSWLHDLAMAVAMNTAGLFGVAVLGAVIAGLLVVVLFGLFRALAPSAPSLVLATGVLLTAVVGSPVWSPRAQVWDVIFLALAAYGWVVYRDRGQKAWLVAMVPMGWLWAALHGSGIGAYWASSVALLVVVALGWLPRDRPARPLLLSVLFTVVAMSAGPYGPALLAYPFETILSQTQATLIQEWGAPDLSDPTFLGLRLMLVAVPALLAVTRARVHPLVGLLALGWTWLALGSARYVALAAPFLAGVAVSSLEVWRARAVRRRAPRAGAPARLATGLALLCVPVVLAIGITRISPAAGEEAISRAFPVAAVDALVSKDCRGRMWNAYGWGGYIAHRWGGLVGAYGAADSLGDLRLSAQIDQALDPEAFAEAVTRDRITLAVVGPGSVPASWLRERAGWTMVAGDGVGELWARENACSNAAP